MNIWIRSFIVFLILFNFRIPLLYSSSVLAVVLSCLYYLSKRKKSIPIDYFLGRYEALIFTGAIVVILICISIAILHTTNEFTLVKVFLLQLFMLFSLVFALPYLLPKEEDSIAFERASCILCHVFALQGAIHLSGLMVPPIGEFFISIKSEALQDRILNDIYDTQFRGYSLTGQPFFELPAGYGVSFILFFRLLLNKKVKLFGFYKATALFVLLLIGSILSGRTAFVGLAMGLLMSLFLLHQPLRSLAKAAKALVLISSLFLFIYGVLPSSQKKVLLNNVFPFAFEAFYNYESTGKFQTRSTDVISESHYFPLSEKTLKKGDGWFDKNGDYYKNTDAGYMRFVLFGGIPFLIVLIIYELLYFARPLQLSFREKTEESRADFYCFLTLLLHIFILNYKGTALGSQNIMQVLILFVGSAYMTRYYQRKNEDRRLINDSITLLT